MSSSLDKLKALTSRLENKLEEKGKTKPQTPIKVQDEPISVTTIVKDTVPKTVSEPKLVPKPMQKISANTVATSIDFNCEDVRENNISRVKSLYESLKIFEKSPDFNQIFIYKAMNLSGIGLKENDFGQTREGKYIQVIAITYEPDKNGKKKAKNISLGYFGKAETLDVTLKNEIIEFVLRWRYEKSFQNVEHYKDLLDILDKPIEKVYEEKVSATLF